MKKIRSSCIHLVALLGAMACGSGDEPAGESTGQAGAGNGEPAPSVEPELENGPGGFEPDYRTSDAFFTLMDEMVMGNSPHGMVQIWYSSNIRDLIETGDFTAPEGTTSIKEFEMETDDGGTMPGIALMVKREAGYDSANGDWYYAMLDMDGNEMPEPPPGRIDMCIDCHSAAARTDYLAGTSMR